MPPNAVNTVAEQNRLGLHIRAMDPVLRESDAFLKEITLTLPTWTAHSTLAPPWDHFPPPPGDDFWIRNALVNIDYRVLKKILIKHVCNTREPWHDIILASTLANLRAAGLASESGSLIDDKLRPHLDRLSALLEDRARRGIEETGLSLREEWAMEEPGWENRLEPRWTLLLPGGLKMLIGQDDKEKKLVSAYHLRVARELEQEERLRALALDLVEEFAGFQDGGLVPPSPKRILRRRHAYGVECVTRIRLNALARWRQILL